MTTFNTSTQTSTQATVLSDSRWAGVRFALVMMAIGGLYSVVSTALNQTIFPHQAQGSLIKQQGQIVGSALVAQPFDEAKYLLGRPSAVATDPLNTAGSNLAVDNPQLRSRVQQHSVELSQRFGVSATQLPVDLLATSGSGIDPDISPAAAMLQVDSIAKARQCDPAKVRQIIEQIIETPLLGPARVNVLQVNLTLDANCR